MKKYSQLLQNSDDYIGNLKSLLADDFCFLEADYEMSRIDLLDGFRYQSARTAVFVRGLPGKDGGPWVGIDRRPEPLGNPGLGLPVWAIMAVRRSKYLYNDVDASIDKFPLYSIAIRECCDDMLLGDFSRVDNVLEWLKNRHEDEKAWFERLMSDTVGKPPRLP